MRDELSWTATTDFVSGIRSTVDWYLDHLQWCERRSNLYAGQRLGRVSV
jgi:dTDP-glucose 4,6-dehydratase